MFLKNPFNLCDMPYNADTWIVLLSFPSAMDLTHRLVGILVNAIRLAANLSDLFERGISDFIEITVTQ